MFDETKTLLILSPSNKFPCTALLNNLRGLVSRNSQLEEAVKQLTLEKRALQKQLRQVKELPEIQAEEGYLEELRRDVLDRQDIFCNGLTFIDFMDQDALEDRMRERAESPAAKALGVRVEDLNRIFKEDTHCGNCREENGKLMWDFYSKWKKNIKIRMDQD